MICKWRVKIGNRKASLALHVEVPDDELAACESDIEREELTMEYVSEDFRSRVYWEIEEESK